MDYKNIVAEEDAVVISDVKNFKLKDIFECGQAFRWVKTEEDSYIAIAFEGVIEIKVVGSNVYIYNSSVSDVENIWIKYFDLNRNYSKIKEELSKDKLLKKAVDFGGGIRILNQDPFELIISFIISANNRIPMIKRAIDKISTAYGKEIEYKGVTYYAFPTICDLKDVTEEEFRSFGVGFRAKYIKSTIEMLSKNNNIKEMLEATDDECHVMLQKFSGVGAKVADCIMLFSMEKLSAFPVDVWVKRAMQHFYLAPDVSLKKIREFAREKFGELSGFAQQYLFYYARENHILE